MLNCICFPLLLAFAISGFVVNGQEHINANSHESVSADSSDKAWPCNTYYIDSQTGNDNNDGLSKDRPWKSHTMVATVKFQPGDTVAFKAGSRYSGAIEFKESGAKQFPITITSYGEGERPRFTNPDDANMNGNAIRLSGSWLILENLHFHDTPPTKNVDRASSIFRMGAVFVTKGADHNIIRDNRFIKCTKGIQSTGEHTLITRNYLDGPSHALWSAPGAKGGWGPMGIQLGIGNQEVSYNMIKNYLTTDSPYGSDGGAIELDDGRYHKDNFYIHHNYSEGNAGFIESSWKHDLEPFQQEVHHLRVAFNVSHDAQAWLYMWAPCHDCYFDNNTVIRTTDFGSPLNDVAYIDFAGIHFRNNLIVHASEVYRGPGASGVSEQNNWYFNIKDPTTVDANPDQSASGDPKLVDLAKGNYRLKPDSPLIGMGINLSKHYGVDHSVNPLHERGPWDIGAFQFQK